MKKTWSVIVTVGSLVLLWYVFGSQVETQAVSEVMENLPFAEKVFPWAKKVLDVGKGTESITANSVFFSLSKGLLSGTVKAMVLMLLSALLLGTRLPNMGGLRSVWIDEAEEVMDGIRYQVAFNAVSVLSGSAAAVVVHVILNPWKDKLNLWYGAVVFIVLYVICSVIFSLRSGYSWGSSLLHTAVFKVLPAMVDMIFFGALYIMVYICLRNYGFWSGKTWGMFLLLFVWNYVMDLFQKWLQRITVSVFRRRGIWSVGGFVQDLFWFMASVITSLLMYTMCVTLPDHTNYFTRAVTSLPFSKEMILGISVSRMVSNDGMGFAASCMVLLFLCMGISLLQLLSRGYATGNLLANMFFWIMQISVIITSAAIVYAIYFWLADILSFTEAGVLIGGTILLILILIFKPFLLLHGLGQLLVLLLCLYLLGESGVSGLLQTEIRPMAACVLMVIGMGIDVVRFFLF